MNHCDILWVDDFDKISSDKQGVIDGKVVAFDIDDEEEDEDSSNTPDTNDYSKQKDNFFPKKYHFRIEIYKYLHKLLLDLEERFSQYTCAVLDVNFQDGFGYTRDKYKEKDEVKKIFAQYNVVVKDGDFDKNAGYYLYLYLLQRGMPAERICMLTANDSDTSEKWKNVFANAGLKAPDAYNRFKIRRFYEAKRLQDDKNSFISKGKPNDENVAESERFNTWLNTAFSNEYSFRSCVIAMSGCLLDMIKKDGIGLRQVWNDVWKEKKVGIESVKYILENVRKLPLRFSKGIEQEYVNVIWQLVSPWEGIERDTGYYTFLKTTRNWLAHRRITKLNLQITAFLFGLSLRGLFDFANVDDSVKSNYEEYTKWEENLLELINTEDDKNNDFDFKYYMLSKLKSSKEEREKKDFSWLTLKSFQGFMWRYKKYVKDSKNQYPINKDIFSIIHNLGENKENKENKDVVVVTDLIREFLHDLYSISIVHSIGKFEESNKIAYKFTYKSEDSSIGSDRIEIRYLENLHKTLQRTIEDEDEKRAKEEENINKEKINRK